jgi:hypothetical protein
MSGSHKSKNDAQLEALLASAPRHIRRAYHTWLDAIAALDAAPSRKKYRTARVWARRLGVLPSSLWSKRSEFRKHGGIVLLDKRFSSACWSARRNALPPQAIQYLRSIAQADDLTMDGVVTVFSSQLARWRNGDKSAAIPGYDTPPEGNPPPGWSARNLFHYLSPRPRTRSERVLFEMVLQFRADGKVTFYKRKARP